MSSVYGFYFKRLSECPQAPYVLQLELNTDGVHPRQVFWVLPFFLRSFHVPGDGHKRISNYWLLFTFVNEMMCARYAPSTSQARAVINYLEFLALTLAWRKKAAFWCSVRWVLGAHFALVIYTWPLTIYSPQPETCWWLCSLGAF